MASRRARELQRNFVIEGVKQNVRLDGRKALEGRRIILDFNHHVSGQVTVRLGDTRVLCIVSGEIIRPRVDRPGEGQFEFNVDLSPMASLDFEAFPAPGSLTHERASELALLVDRVLKKSRAVDAESLCIEEGARAWAITVDIRVLEDDGNLKDATTLAAIAALLRFKRKDLGTPGTLEADRLPAAPLCIHHVPVVVTVAYFESEDIMAIDPSAAEEVAMAGELSIALNQYGELCSIHKSGGLALSPSALETAINVATIRARSLIEELRSAVDEDEKRVKKAQTIWQKYADQNTPAVLLDSSSGSLATDSERLVSDDNSKAMDERKQVENLKVFIAPTPESVGTASGVRLDIGAGGKHTKGSSLPCSGTTEAFEAGAEGSDIGRPRIKIEDSLSADQTGGNSANDDLSVSATHDAAAGLLSEASNSIASSLSCFPTTLTNASEESTVRGGVGRVGSARRGMGMKLELPPKEDEDDGQAGDLMSAVKTGGRGGSGSKRGKKGNKKS